MSFKKIFTVLIVMVLAIWVSVWPAFASTASLALPPGNQVDYVFGTSAAGAALTGQAAITSDGINVAGLNGPVCFVVTVSATGANATWIDYQVNSLNTSSSYGYPDAPTHIIKTAAVTTATTYRVCKQVVNLGWIRLIAYPITSTGSTMKVTVKIYRPSTGGSPAPVTLQEYPISTTACDDTIITRKATWISKVVINRVLLSTTDENVILYDGSSTAGTDKGRIGIEATGQYTESVIFDPPQYFADGLYAEFETGTGHACIRVWEAY